MTILAKLAMDKRCCLLCFEVDPNYCHRLFVAERLSSITDTSFEIHHLINQEPIQTAPVVSDAV